MLLSYLPTTHAIRGSRCDCVSEQTRAKRYCLFELSNVMLLKQLELVHDLIFGSLQPGWLNEQMGERVLYAFLVQGLSICASETIAL